MGLLGKIVGAAKGLAGRALKGTPVGQAVAGVGGKILKRLNRKGAKAAVAAVAAGVAGTGAALKKAARTPGGAAVMAGGAGVMAGAVAGRGGGGEGRRYRRMNPGNTRAMRRAIRRVESGARLYSKFFAVRKGRIKGAPGVHVKKLSIRRAA